jgi:protein-S-isoprenylcysteine O-methyltransferase Ste14
MILKDTIKAQGDFLFRWRSYMPLLAAPLFVCALYHSNYLQHQFGDRVNNLWEAFCILVSMSGLMIRALVAGYVPRGTSGRNTQGQAANSLNTQGMYSIVRNPLYIGNFVICLGIFLFIQVWWLVLIAVVGYYFYYERIVFTEEDYLHKKFGDYFLQWANKTPAFLPNFRNWKTPDVEFSFKTVLRREFSTFFAIIATLTGLNVAADLFSEKKLQIEMFWVVLFLSGLAFYCAMVVLKKKTTVLNVVGR